MPKDRSAKLSECIDQKLKEYEDYDNALTAVSSWRAIFDATDYQGRVAHFDWFPVLPTDVAGHRVDLTPDFSVLMELDLGLIFDIKASFPRDDEAFDGELTDLSRYDKVAQLRSGTGTLRQLKDASIVVLLDRNNGSHEIAARVLKKLQDTSHPFKMSRQLVILDFAFMETRGKTFFDIRYVPMPGNGRFCHPILTDHFITFNRAARMSPTHFGPYKAKYVLTNDTPPPITLLVFLWGRALYGFLTPGQRRQFAAERNVTLRLSAPHLSATVNGLFPEAQPLSLDLSRKILKRLADIGLARLAGGEEYDIDYRDLTRGRRVYAQEGREEHEFQKELAHVFAERLCKASPEQPEQRLLFEPPRR